MDRCFLLLSITFTDLDKHASLLWSPCITNLMVQTPQARLGGGVVFRRVQLGRGHFDSVLVLPRVLGNVC
jgi:hypothetical protein